MNSFINISEGAYLAFHSLALIASSNPKRLNTSFIARKLKASEAHLAKVFQRLSKAGIVSSVRGPSGGFILSRPSSEINFLMIYEIMEAKTDVDGCPLGKTECSFDLCIFSTELNRISLEIRNTLEGIRLSDFNQATKTLQNSEASE
jgi:Rrf2 family protein